MSSFFGKKKAIPESELPKQSAINTLIYKGLYKLTYDGKGEHEASLDKRNKFFKFTITNSGDKVVGEYHVHKTIRGYVSGSLYILDGNTILRKIGYARQWGNLCKKYSKDIK
ncbi:MAG: hypothetical protein RPU60_02620 [Candidatus Sedimenticola sp. (ex Thyasira tokunagai)]